MRNQTVRKREKKQKPKKRLIEIELQEKIRKLTKEIRLKDLELSAIKEKKEKEVAELGRISRLLAKKENEFSEVKAKREAELHDLNKKTKELEESRIALMNILEDVEEAHRRAEEEKNKTLAIITNFADGILVFNEDNDLSLINPQAESFFNVKEKDVFSKSLWELNFFPKLKPLISLIGENIKGLFRKEFAIEENLILEVTTLPVMSEEKKIGTLIILHDITREKMVERLKTEFVSVSAHQLRTPLSAVKWTLRMFLDGDLGEINREQKSFLEKTYQSNERMIDLINDLLNVARIEEGRYLYKPVLLDLASLTQAVVNTYQEESKKKKIIFEFEAPKEKLPGVMADSEKMQLAIQNLIDNAIRYTPAGGKVKVFLKKTDKNIEFSVKDSGIGIPKEQQKRVFTKFFRAANAIRTETEGTGLGLFIAKNIVEAHGGKIWFESEEGRGTTFFFIIPIEEEFKRFIEGF